MSTKQSKYLGSKGRTSDRDYRTSHLRLLGALQEAILGTGGAPLPGGIATEATLLQILAKEDTEFQMQYLQDANDTLVWVEVDMVDGVKTYSYFDSPGGSAVVPVQPLRPLSLSTDAELIEDEYIAVTTNLTNGYTAGDIISKISYFDLSTGTPVLLNSFWYNKTTSAILTTVNILDLEDQDGPILQTPGVAGDTFTSPASPCIAVNMIFDADNVLIENKSNKDVLVTLGGILGNDYVAIKNTSKEVKIDVPHINSIQVCGVGGAGWTGDVHVTYSRGK